MSRILVLVILIVVPVLAVPEGRMRGSLGATAAAFFRSATLCELMQSGGGRFATTQWTLVLAAGRGGSAEAEAALAYLCSAYWYPIYVFVRRRGHSVEDAQDLTQSFFTRLLEKKELAAADRDRGRFRTFLLTACQHFLLNERDRALAIKRGGGAVAVPIDSAAADLRYQSSLVHDETPEHLFHRQWCLTLLASVLDTLRDDYRAAGNEVRFERLRRFLTSDDDPGTHADAAAELNMSAEAVKVAVHRLRRRYRDELLRHVAATVDSPEAVDDEIRCLLKTLTAV